jgi:integrase
MRKTLTDRGVAALKARPQRYAFPDPELTGFYVRVTPGGRRTFVTVARNPDGKQVWTTIGATDVLTIAEARETGREVIRRVRAGLAAVEAPPVKPDTFEDVAEQWLKRHAQAKGLRSLRQITRLLRVHVFPMWGDRAFLSIQRSDIATLLDRVEDHHSARQADCVLTVVRSIANWYASRHDGYQPPFVRGMRRQNPKEHTRARILNDAELAAIWKQAETDGTFGALVRLLLLTGQRRAKVAGMKWENLALDGTWTIPQVPREKDAADSLMLPAAAIAIIRAQPRLGDNPYVLAGRGNGYFNGYSKAKRRFDAKLPDMPQWQLHDLRRTARSLLSRAGVRPDIAERVLGHSVEGVQGVYDRHNWRDEKADALRRLATLIASIVDPVDNVVPMVREAAQ